MTSSTTPPKSKQRRRRRIGDIIKEAVEYVALLVICASSIGLVTEHDQLKAGARQRVSDQRAGCERTSRSSAQEANNLWLHYTVEGDLSAQKSPAAAALHSLAGSDRSTALTDLGHVDQADISRLNYEPLRIAARSRRFSCTNAYPSRTA